MATSIPPIDVDHYLKMNHAVKSSSVTACYHLREVMLRDNLTSVTTLIMLCDWCLKIILFQ